MTRMIRRKRSTSVDFAPRKPFSITACGVRGLLSLFLFNLMIRWHAVTDYLKKTSDTIRGECRLRSTLGSKLMGDKAERKEQREREADRIVQTLASGRIPLQKQLWYELNQLMERAKNKYLK